jgi:azurin
MNLERETMRWKSWTVFACTLTIALALTGCPTAPAVDEIVITGDDMMRFSTTSFTVEAGSTVTVIFRNIGRMPKEAMGHNLAILEQGTDTLAFARAAVRHAGNEYIPPEMEDQVIASTPVLGPGEEATLTFTAPTETGDYPFVCSFPGHTEAGMVGTMTVR